MAGLVVYKCSGLCYTRVIDLETSKRYFIEPMIGA